jgi:hypothetical protein
MYRHLSNPTPTLPLPLKGREKVMFLPLQALNLIWYRARGRLALHHVGCRTKALNLTWFRGGGWGLLEQYKYVSSFMDLLVSVTASPSAAPLR